LLSAIPTERPSAKQLKRSSKYSRYVLKHGRSHPIAQTFSKADALCRAAENGCLDIVELLLLDVSLKRQKLWKEVTGQCMNLAVANRHKGIVHRLLQVGVDGSYALYKAAQEGDHQEMIYLTESNISGHSTKHNRIRNALKYAIEWKDVRAAKALVEGLNYSPCRAVDKNRLYEQIGASDSAIPNAVSELFCLLNMVRVGFEDSSKEARIRYPITSKDEPPTLSALIHDNFWFYGLVKKSN